MWPTPRLIYPARERAPGITRIGAWVGHQAGLEGSEVTILTRSYAGSCKLPDPPPNKRNAERVR
jgi:hypothetical protein